MAAGLSADLIHGKGVNGFELPSLFHSRAYNVNGELTQWEKMLIITAMVLARFELKKPPAAAMNNPIFEKKGNFIVIHQQTIPRGPEIRLPAKIYF
jgi:hypothetical protein